MSAKLRILLPSFTTLTPTSWLVDMPSIVEACGRVSHKTEEAMTNDSFNWFIPKVTQKLGHESITEHVAITVKILCSRACSHQLVRHRLAAYTMESQRYVDYANKNKTPAMCVIVPPSILTSSSNFCEWEKLNHLLVMRGPEGLLYCQEESSALIIPISLNKDEGVLWTFFNALLTSYESYLFLRDAKVPPEDARFVLPNASKTEIATTYDIKEWRHVFKLRCDRHAQWEIRFIMQAILRSFLDSPLKVFFEDLEILLQE